MNMITRRRFLEAIVALGLAGSSAAARALGGAAAPPLTRSWFSPYLGTPFQICDASGQQAAMVLMSLDPLLHTRGFSSPDTAAQYCFAARYVAPADTPKIDGLCTVKHPQLGSFSLFLTPIGRSGKSWEAVFNRIA
jgi:uncharacterized protein DUF6916